MSKRGRKPASKKANTECWYCGKKGHNERECWKNCVDSNKSGSRFDKTEQVNRQRLHYVVGSEGSGNGLGLAFMMKHKEIFLRYKLNIGRTYCVNERSDRCVNREPVGHIFRKVIYLGVSVGDHL